MVDPSPNEDELTTVLRSLKGVFDGEEVVDELSHALQCGDLARRAGASPKLITAALFHDVARSPFFSQGDHPTPHETIGARWLRPRFGEYVAWVAGAHVAAKLHLLATEVDYAAQLSPESARSASHQRATSWSRLLDHPWWDDAIELRRWDDAAKDPDAELPDPDELLSIAKGIRLA